MEYHILNREVISCRLQFTDSARFMASSFSNIVNNGHNNKKCETCGIKYKRLQLLF